MHIKNSSILCYATRNICDDVRDVFIFLHNFVSAYFVHKLRSNIYDRYHNSKIEVEEILENGTYNSETKSSLTEEKQRHQFEDSLMIMNVVQAPSARSKILDVDSLTNENTTYFKHVDDNKSSSEDEAPIQNNDTESSKDMFKRNIDKSHEYTVWKIVGLRGI